jgi:hypothetical protein
VEVLNTIMSGVGGLIEILRSEGLASEIVQVSICREGVELIHICKRGSCEMESQLVYYCSNHVYTIESAYNNVACTLICMQS